MLVRAGVLSAEQLEEALAEKAETGKRLGEIVVDRGWVSSSDLARALAEQHHCEFIDVMEAEIEDAAASLLPERLARRYRAVPIRFLGEDEVLVAVADPTDVLASDDLRLALGMNIEFAVADQNDLERTLGKLYRVEFDVDTDMALDDGDDEVTDVRDVAATSAPAIKLVHSVLSRAIEEEASDVHFEPGARELGRPRPHRRRHPRADDDPEVDAGRGHEPPQDHGRARHRRAAPAAGRPRLDPLRAAAHGPAHGRAADDLRRESHPPHRRHAPRRRSAWTSSA